MEGGLFQAFTVDLKIFRAAPLLLFNELFFLFFFFFFDEKKKSKGDESQVSGITSPQL